MTVVLEKNIEKVEFEKILTKINLSKKPKGVDTTQFCGIIKLKKDPLTIQKEMRDEWK